MFQRAKDGCKAWLALSTFYGGPTKNSRKMVVSYSALETLTWSNEASFKFIDYATQLINHYETLDCGRQPKTDEEKGIKLLGSMSTINGFLLTWMKMNCTGVTFAKAIVNISTSIAPIFPLVNVKGRQVIVPQVGTNNMTSYYTHYNGISFNDKNWDKHLDNEDYKCIPTQIKKLIGFAKANGFIEKQSVFLKNRQQSRKNKKGGVSQVPQAFHYGPSQDNPEDEMVERAISKIAQYYTKNDSSGDDSGSVAPDASSSSKSNANAGSTFRR